MDFIEPILGVLEFTGPSICKCLKYHRKFNDFVSNFKRLQEDLHKRKDAVESRLGKELHFGKRENPEVTKWLEDVVKVTEDAQRVEDKVRKGKYFSRACLGKLVEEETQKMTLLYEKGNSLQILVLDDPSSSSVSSPTSELDEEDVQEKIWSYLEGDQVNKIGVCGTGGIGKTTIMKHIHNELLKKDKFGRIVWVTVSQEFDIWKLQKNIVSGLTQSGLNEELEEDRDITWRAAKLLAILQRRRPFVLILDDVWTGFCLEDVGIPEPTAENGCKLILTTRLKEVARSMGCEIVDVKPLEKDQALKLFRNKVGNDILSPTLESTLEMIVDECAGLPLAIVTVAGSLRRISDPRLWKNALNELIEHKRTVAGTEADKFGTLKFSYDYLKDEKIQHCFLYCALYPEDHKIQKDEIIEYWIEEGLIEEMQTRQAMNYKGHDILRKLEDNCLLEFIEDVFGGEFVRMHDLLRDMALHITSISPRFLVKVSRKLPEEHEWKEDLLKVSLMYNNIEEIPLSLPSPKCPMLTTLLLSHNHFSKIPESFFDHMLGLKILDLSSNYELHSLPNSISKLGSLTTLLLKACWSFRMIPSLSNLGALKKLDLSETSIEELPHGIEMLTNLKYLDLSQMRTSAALHKMLDGILPNLSKLQYLAVDYGIPLKTEGGKLSKLETFMGRFLTFHDMSIFFKSPRDCLSWYNIFVGRQILSYDGTGIIPIGIKFIQFINAQISGEPNLLPSDVQNLGIEGCNDVRSLNDISGFQDATNLLQCKISRCEDIECVLSSWLNLLPSLYYLEIFDMKNLNALFEVKVVAKSAPPPTIFSSLKTIKILFCPKIKKLFSPRLLLGCLQNLEEIKVEHCEELEEIIASKEEESRRVSKLTLPKLKKLELRQLPTLRCICSLTTVLVCDSIKEVTIMYCPDLEHVFGSWFNPLWTLERMNLQGLESLKSMFDEETLALLSPALATTFSPLIRISIGGCHQLKKLFSLKLLLSSLHNLETLEVWDCGQMEEIVASEEEESRRVSKLTLPKLKTLELEQLPTLRCICSSTAILVCDSIEEVTIKDCSDLKCVFGSWFNPLQTLERLNLWELEKLKSVFDEETLALLSPSLATTFSPLVSISIRGCHQLKKLFSLKLLLSCLHNLETLEVQDCGQMEELVASEEESRRVSKLTLPKLKKLELQQLPTLRCICSSTAILVCDSIKEVTIMYCSNLKHVFGSWFNPLWTLERMNLQGLESLKSVFNEETLALLSSTLATTFSPLISISIRGCHSLKKLFSPKLLLSCLHNLEILEVWGCGQMEEIVASEEEESRRVSKLTLPKLKTLELKWLPSLRCICSSTTVLVCDSIEEVTIMNCSDLKCVFGSWFNPLQTLERLNLWELENLKSVFDEETLALLSPALATTFSPLVSISIRGCHQLKKLFSPKLLLSCLHNLETLEVRDCGQMEEIVASKEEEESKRVSKLTLLKLKTLDLGKLPSLRCICSSTTVLVCDSIEEVTIMDCSDLKCVFGSWFNPLQTLERLNLWELENLKSVFDEETLALLSPALSTTFSPLVSISIRGCHQLKKLFSPKLLLSCLHNLEILEVWDCGQMEEMVALEEEESRRVSKLTLPKLKTLDLGKLPSLRCICSSTAILICYSIEEVTIKDCSDLKCVFGSWFNPLQTLERLNLQGLESLKSVFDEETLALLSPALATTFSPLVSISIRWCHQLKKLFSPKLLLSCLHNLETLVVLDCGQMEEIVASEEEESGRVSKLTLPKFKSLLLVLLPSLRCISSSTTVLVCDCIKNVTIIYCSNLKRVFGSWFNPLQTLERLNLWELENLKSVFDEETLTLLSPALATTFSPLVSISIKGCHQLKKLFSPKLLLSCLQNLETIQIVNCKQMEEIISLGSQEEEKALQLSLPKLWKLILKDLPALKSIYSNINVLRCDSLQYLVIIRCTELKRIPLYLPQLDNGQPLLPPSLREIIAFPKEWWEALEWDHPKAKENLLPFCQFEDEEPLQWLL